MSTLPKVDILLATCNGEKFLAEQIESILAQTYSNTRLIVRDDASQDRTLSIIQEYQQRFPKKILCLPSHERLGVKGNFSRLMESSSAPYAMLADQDDIWMPKKVEKTFEHMLELEKKYTNQPLLVHTDLVVVDEQLNVLKSSFWKYIHIKPYQKDSLNRLLNQNVVTGCTLMMNRLMIEIAKPIPEEAVMHDWWLALVASAFGKIGIIREPTMFYRQHHSNTLGAQKFANFRNFSKQFQKLMRKDVRPFNQAAVFFHRYHELLDPSHRQVVKAFLNLQRLSWLPKRYGIIKHQFFKQGLLRNLADFVLG